MIAKVFSWAGRMLSEESGQPSTKRVCFFVSVVFCLLFAAAHIVIKRGLDNLVIDLAKTTLITAASAYGVTRFAEK